MFRPGPVRLERRSGGTGSVSSASVVTSEPRGVERRAVSIGGARIVGLSPDGTRFAAVQARSLCAYDVEALAELACAALTTGSISPWSITWSPDSARIAFTEDFVVRLDESDWWVLQVEGGALTNLTDDGTVTRLARPGPEGIDAQDDLAPAWSPDGTMLAFSRSSSSRAGTAIYDRPVGSVEVGQGLDWADNDSL